MENVTSELPAAMVFSRQTAEKFMLERQREKLVR